MLLAQLAFTVGIGLAPADSLRPSTGARPPGDTVAVVATLRPDPRLAMVSTRPVGAHAPRASDTLPYFPSCLERELRAASRYGGWGGAIGTAAGVVAGIVRMRQADETDLFRGFFPVAYGLTGFVGGVTAGMGTYTAGRAAGWIPEP